MCGIAGWVDRAGLGPGAARVVETMADAIAHRGPDGGGLWAGPQAVLGHRRLAVLDPVGGHQPMTIADDANETVLAMTYSGEVYNHAVLRTELERQGCKFRTGTDTEVVLHAYRQWGLAFVERLVGIFAFAIWDAEQQRLVLVRDRLGVKPLYYAPHQDGTLFASEPKALHASGFVDRVPDHDGLRDLLASVCTPGTTLFRKVRELPPATLAVLDHRGLREHRYWRLTAQPHPHDLATTVGRVRELLGEAVDEQLCADVPLGALLSGGLDSSALVALATRAGRARGHPPLPTYAVDFAGHSDRFAPDTLRDTPDGPYVRDMAAHCATNHHDIVLDTQTLADPAHRRRATLARDAPAAGDMDVSMLLLFQAVSRHVTVALSGESADEVFGGYPWFHDPARVAADDYPWRYLAGRSGTPLALLRTEVATDLDVTGHRARHYRDALAEAPNLPGETGAQARMRTLLYLHLTRWLPDLLDRKDRLSMAVGLEVRVPFCDHRLIEYAFNVPWALHTHDGREKSLLRAATADLLPASVRERRKAPYPTTQDPAYDTAVRDQAADLLAEPAAPVWDYLDPHAIRARLRRGPGHPATRSGLEFALNLNLWLRPPR